MILLIIRTSNYRIPWQNNHFCIILIEELKVDNIKELRTREGECIELIMPALNKNIPGRDIKPHQIDNKENCEFIERIILENIGKIIITCCTSIANNIIKTKRKSTINKT